MILVDANIIVAYWRKPGEDVAAVFRSHEVGICSVTRAEILHGCRDERDYSRTEVALNGLSQVGVEDNAWVALGRTLFTLRINGITVPFQDALLASVAVADGHEVWTSDRHFRMMQRVLPRLLIFPSSPV